MIQQADISRHGARDAWLNALIGLPLTNGGPAYTFQQVVGTMTNDSFPARVFAPIDRRPDASGKRPTITGLPDQLAKLPYRVTRYGALPRIEAKFARACAVQAGRGAAYLWSELSVSLARQLSQQGTFVVREKINCGKQMSRRIIEAAYAGLGASAHLPAAFSDARVEKERVELHLADAIFCPSPMVRQSLLEIGIPDDRLLDTSYGFDPERLRGEHRALPPIDGATLLFVGTLCVRKGAHLLLESWARAGIKGRLILVGGIEPLIARRYADILARPDVEVHGFQHDVGSYFRSADYFIFPTLEEGGPQVTYEAGSCGLPSLTTPMGAGAFLRDGVEGLIIDPNDADGWVDVIRSIKPGSEAHKAESAAARVRAADFVWDEVGRKRRSMLLEKVFG